MLKSYLLVLFLIFYSAILWGEELVYYTSEVKNIGIIYDVAEFQEKKTIFIASEKGVFSYSGKVLEKVRATPNDIIHKLIVSDHIVYGLSFNNKIYKYENDSLTLFCEVNVNEIINSFLVKDQKAYLTTPHNLAIVESNIRQTIIPFKNEYILGILTKKDSSYLFFQNKDKVRIQNIENNTSFKTNFNTRISKVFFTDYGNYIQANDEIFSVDLNNKKIDKLFVLPKELVKVKIFEIKRFNKNTFFIANNNGFSVFNKKTERWNHFLNKTTIHSIIQTNKNSIWLGTKFEGLLQIPSLNINQLEFNSFLHKKDKVVKTYMKDENLFLGTNLGNVIIYNLQTKKSTSVALENNGEVQSMFVYKNRLYVYCDLLYEINLLNLKIVKTYETHSTRAIYVDDKGVYCATTGDFQSILENLKENTGFWHNCIYSDSLTPFLYVGMKSGLSTFQKKPFSFINNIKTVTKERIIAILKEDGKIRCYGAEGGVYTKDLKLINKYPIKSIKGVLNISKKEKIIYTKKALFYSTKNTLREIEFVLNLIEDQDILSINKYRSSLIISTTTKTVIIKNYRQLFMKGVEKDVSLIIKTNVTIEDNNFIFLDYKNDGMQFIVSTNNDLSFFNSLNIAYSINNKELIPIAKNQKGKLELALEFLPEGKTELIFFALNNSGNILDQQSINVFVESPFWKSIWFYLTCLGVCVLFLFLYQKQRIAKITAKNIESIQKERIKTRLVRSELIAIRSQMNPHFIFNTLSTIQLKIAKKETTLAFKLVQRFSSLMRGILNYSQVELISLKEELSILKNYIELEQERFEEKVLVDIEIDEDIDVDYFKIPSLITQPIVENSLQHGLRHKEGDKRLKIKMHILNETTYCVEITDNGIGIDAANKINAENNMNSSFAMNAIKKRINFINSLDGMNVNIDIKSNKKGTTVKILINNYD